MNNPPTIVKLLRFPESLRLTRKGRQFIGALHRSGPIVLSERHDAVDVTLRVTMPGFSFLTGGDSITVTEAFNEGEQRDVLVPWQLVVNGDQRPAEIVLEIDAAYSGTTDLHTATAPIELTYGMSSGQATAVAAGAALAAAAVAAVAAGRRKRKVVEDEDELTLLNIGRSRGSNRGGAGKVVEVRDADDTDIEVLNVGRTSSRSTKKKGSSTKRGPAKARSASSTKKASAKKSSAKKGSAKKASTKKASTKKQSPAKKKAPAKKASAKKAGGTGRGSSASRSAQRTGARGSSKARKSPARRSTRKSR